VLFGAAVGILTVGPRIAIAEPLQSTPQFITRFSIASAIDSTKVGQRENSSVLWRIPELQLQTTPSSRNCALQMVPVKPGDRILVYPLIGSC